MNIGIIMDGNGRWATAQGEPRLTGHAAGIEAVKQVVRQAPTLGIDSITLFAFAIANWKRDQEEVDGLWVLFETFLKEHTKELLAEGVRVRVIGNRGGLPKKIRLQVENIEQESADQTKFLLQIALNYDGIEEVARLVARAIEECIPAKQITSEYILQNLDTLPEATPDIVIRTGMPKSQETMSIWRSSAFLPLQSTQSVCVSSTVLWPDFTIEHLKEIITYAKPDARLFGGQRQEE